MHTGTLSVRKLFEQDRRYVVPLYQRPYVWNEADQWQPLWDDICAVSDRIAGGTPTRAHFMGAIVLEEVSQPTGELERRLVIDGQQRLTTMQLVLKALADVLETIGEEHRSKKVRDLTRNDPVDVDSEGIDYYKLWPTNQDQTTFRHLMEFSSLAAAMAGLKTPPTDFSESLGGAYLFFARQFTSWLRPSEDGVAERAKALYLAVADHIRLVVIDLDQSDDPQVIFETLNARGTPLLPADLVKNALFHRGQRAGENVDQLYRLHWQPFEQDAKYWRKDVGRGHAKRARIDTYLQHYLTMRQKNEVAVGHLYASFREYLASRDGESANSLLADVARFSREYRRIDEQEAEGRELVFFSRLAAMEVTTLVPALLKLHALCAHHPDQWLSAAVDLESFLVRRMVCHLNTRGYSRLFVDLLNALGDDGAVVAASVREFLLSSSADAARWPDDDEFGREWSTAPLYTRITRRRLRMLLEAVDARLTTGMTERVVVGEKLTVEHLMPQEWREHWPLPAGVEPHEAAEERAGLLHTIGNLTLVTGKLNPSMSNVCWDDKRDALRQHTALTMNRRLLDIGCWDEMAIRTRSAELLEVARSIWSHPGSPS